MVGDLRACVTDERCGQFSELVQVDEVIGAGDNAPSSEDSSNIILHIDKLRSCIRANMMDGLDIVCSVETVHAELQAFDFAGARLFHFASTPLEATRARPVNRGIPVAVAILQLDGTSELFQDNKHCVLSKGSFAFVDVAMPLELRHLCKFDQLYLQFPHGTFTTASLRAASVVAMKAESPIDRPFYECIKNVWQAAPLMHPLNQRAAVSALMCLSKLTSAFSDNKPKPEVSVRVRRAMNFIEHHLGDHRLNAQIVADRHGVSRRYLDELFALSGYRVEAWIWERRLTRAAEELSLPDSFGRSLLQIALDVGFKTPSHFSRAFSQRFGMSPRDYRKDRAGAGVAA
jgi:AraC-like DNA-binding protein